MLFDKQGVHQINVKKWFMLSSNAKLLQRLDRQLTKQPANSFSAYVPRMHQSQVLNQKSMLCDDEVKLKYGHSKLGAPPPLQSTSENNSSNCLQFGSMISDFEINQQWPMPLYAS